MPNIASLKCLVTPGMFSEELVVEVEGVDRRRHSYFVDRSKASEADGTVQVEVLRRNGVTWVVLPTNYHDTVAVDETVLMPVS